MLPEGEKVTKLTDKLKKAQLMKSGIIKERYEYSEVQKAIEKREWSISLLLIFEYGKRTHMVKPTYINPENTS